MPDYRGLTQSVAQRYFPNPRDQQIFVRQIQQESGFNPTARSPAGALGIAQIVPRWHPGVDPMNPTAALNYAAKLDAANLKKYGNWNDALSIYNSGRGWSTGQKIGETNNYVNKILGAGGVAPSSGGAGSPTVPAPSGFSTSPLPNNRAAFAMAMIQAMQAPKQGQQAAMMNAIMQLRGGGGGAPPGPSGAPAPAPGFQQPGPTKGNGRGVREMFYDPLGAYDEGSWINPIGGHSDHVHVSFGTPAAALAIIKQGQKMGLRVSENPYTDTVDPVHTKTSYHYKTFPGQFGGRGLGEAADVSGQAAQMAAFFNWIKTNYLG